jgi:hypothetical protein
MRRVPFGKTMEPLYAFAKRIRDRCVFCSVLEACTMTKKYKQQHKHNSRVQVSSKTMMNAIKPTKEIRL